MKSSSRFTVYGLQFGSLQKLSLFLIPYSLLLVLSLSASAQHADYKDRNEGDTVVVNKKTYLIHKCKKDETVFTIATKYHVSVNDLDNANKDVINNLKKNTVLLIPVSKKKEKEELKKEEAKAVLYKDSTYKIALLIPFNENRNYTVDSTLVGGYAMNADLDKETVNVLEFYEGVLAAIDSLRKNGLKAKITVIDAYDSPSIIKAKMDTEVKEADVIITNLSQNLIGFLNYYSVNGKPVILSCGTNTSASLKGDSSAFFTAPSSLLQCRQMGEYFANDEAAKNRFIIIKTAFSKEIERSNAFNSGLIGTNDKEPDKVFLDTTIKPIKSIDGLMTKGKNNIVFLPSTDESFASEVINILKKYADEFKITLVGLPTWQYFQSVSPEDLQLLHTTIFSGVYINYESASVVAFRKIFRDKYFTEPSENAFSGYDAMMFLGEQLLGYGVNFSAHAVDKNYTELSTNFHFVKESGGNGFENNYISILQFGDYVLKKVNK